MYSFSVFTLKYWRWLWCIWVKDIFHDSMHIWIAVSANAKLIIHYQPEECVTIHFMYRCNIAHEQYIHWTLWGIIVIVMPQFKK